MFKRDHQNKAVSITLFSFGFYILQ